MERLDPKLDVTFKMLFTRQPELLRNMLEGVLAEPITELTVLNPAVPGPLVGDKAIEPASTRGSSRAAWTTTSSIRRSW